MRRTDQKSDASMEQTKCFLVSSAARGERNVDCKPCVSSSSPRRAVTSGRQSIRRLPFVGGNVVSKAERKTEARAGVIPKSGEPDSDVGNALRSVYEKAVGEDIPQEMLDLLGKLK